VDAVPPAHCRDRAVGASGRIGEVRYVTADLGGYAAVDPHSRLFDPMLGGGALLNIGVYLISFAHLILGARRRILASSNPSVAGVDSQTSVMLEYARGQQALLLMSFEANTPSRATIKCHPRTDRDRRPVLSTGRFPGGRPRRTSRVLERAARWARTVDGRLWTRSATRSGSATRQPPA
jgi:hypothetical protein